MAESIRTFAECRIPALENRLFDIFLSIPTRYKTNWQVYKKAIEILSPDLMEIRNANTNVRAADPLWIQSLKIWYRAFVNRMVGDQNLLRPRGSDRSWISTADHILENSNLSHAIQSLPRSEALASLSFLDMKSVASLVEEHQSGTQDHAILLIHLLNLDRLLAAN